MPGITSFFAPETPSPPPMAEKALISVEEAEKILSAFPAAIKTETRPSWPPRAASWPGISTPLSPCRNSTNRRWTVSPISRPTAPPAYQDHRNHRRRHAAAAGRHPRPLRQDHDRGHAPRGADRVVKRECTREENGVMTIIAEDRNRNIRKKGEDLQAGQLVLSAGERLRAAQIALLASLGMADVPTARPPRVGIITTGSELVDPGAPLAPGQIYNSNSYSLAAQIRETGAEALLLGRVADDAAATRRGHRRRPGEMRGPDPFRRRLGRRFRFRARGHEGGRLHPAF